MRPVVAPEGTALYVHLPFCAAKCHYCDFFSVAAHGQDRASMLAAILREAELRAPMHPQTVFFGGGTPSLLSLDELRTLLEALERITAFRGSALEVTLECNPESLDRDKARLLRELGVTRLSIGFQSLDAAVLAQFGRVHSVEQSFRAFEAARAAGFENLNIDMIYAVPGQTLASWTRDLERVIALAPEHLSAYNLTFEEGTLFRRWLDEGRLARQPEELELAFFEATRSVLLRRGYTAYEISNFCLHGLQCSHNVNYWRNGTYVGIGPSAASKVALTRSGNPKAIGSYCRQMLLDGRTPVWQEELEPLHRLAETWWLGLRLAEGLDAREARERSEFEAEDDPALEIAQRLVRAGLLECESDRFRLSSRGLPLADYVAREFLEALGSS